MFVRLTFLGLLPGKSDEAKKIYEEEIIPELRKQNGNIDCRLLEPVDDGDDHISMTTWKTKEDADSYHSGGVYNKLVGRVANLFAKPPVLKVYTTEDLMEHA